MKKKNISEVNYSEEDLRLIKLKHNLYFINDLIIDYIDYWDDEQFSEIRKARDIMQKIYLEERKLQKILKD